MINILKKMVENQKNGKSFVLATVVEGADKSPGRSGFKMISYLDGTSEGTVGGGELEKLVLEKCSEIHRSKQNDFLSFNLTKSGIGMLCGGNIKVYCEYFSAPKKVFAFGGGHLCQSLIPLLKSVGFHCVVIDNREEFASKNNLPKADEIIFSNYVDFVEKMKLTANDAIVIFTHGHLHDLEILDKICERNLIAKYIGMIGSKIKVPDTIQKIKQKKYGNNLVDSINAPIGLNIAKTTTSEIAVAIVAEILAKYNGVKEIKFMKAIK